MAFMRTQIGRSYALIIANADGSGERVLATRTRPAGFIQISINGQPSYGPAWSPDGGRIVLAGFDASGGVQVQQVVSADTSAGSEKAVSVSAEDGNGLVWLDAGSLALSASPEEGAPAQLWRVSYPDGQLSRLTNDLNSYAGLSVTGDRASLVTTRTERRVGIWVGAGSAGNGTEAVVAAPVSGANYGVTCAADRLLYPANSAGRTAIVGVVPGGGPAEEIVLNGTSPVATSDGRTMVYMSTESGARAGLWKAAADSRGAVQLIAGNANSPAVTPDDRRVLFTSSRAGLQSRWNTA